MPQNQQKLLENSGIDLKIQFKLVEIDANGRVIENLETLNSQNITPVKWQYKLRENEKTS